jgi:hypothetical protein
VPSCWASKVDSVLVPTFYAQRYVAAACSHSNSKTLFERQCTTSDNSPIVFEQTVMVAASSSDKQARANPRKGRHPFGIRAV